MGFRGKEFRKAVDQHPNYAEARLELAKMYLHNQRLAEARDAARQAIAAERLLRLNLGLVQMHKRDYSGAEKSLTMFSQLSPDDPQVPKARTLLEQIEKAQK